MILRPPGLKLVTLALASWLAVPAMAQIQHVSPKQRTPPDDLSEADQKVATLYRNAIPAVVTILTEGVALTNEGPQASVGLGSGVLISGECHILTAAHVVDHAQRIRVRTQDGVEREAIHLFSEARADLALLRLAEPDVNLPHAVLGDSDRLAVGQTIYAIGNPYGLENTLTVGNISSFRDFDQLYDGTILAEFIQTDAAINSGNSGGPLFDASGRVVGIASRIFSVSGGSQGLGFAVAINTAKQLLALEERVWMGFDAIYLAEAAVHGLFNRDLEGALLVQQVIKGSPADKAGLIPGNTPAVIAGQEILLGGDLIIAIGDQAACHEACLVHAHDRLRGASEIEISILRAGKPQVVRVDVSAARRSFLAPEP